jgi:hypothetical protein
MNKENNKESTKNKSKRNKTLSTKPNKHTPKIKALQYKTK